MEHLEAEADVDAEAQTPAPNAAVPSVPPSCSPSHLPAERLDAIHELIVDLNSELTLAWFDCPRANRVVSARASLDTTDVEVTETLIGNVVGAAVETMGRFLPAIDAVAAGEVNPADLREPTGQVPTLNLDQATPDEIASFVGEHFDGG